MRELFNEKALVKEKMVTTYDFSGDLGDDGSCHGSDDCGTELVGDGPCDCRNELA